MKRARDATENHGDHVGADENVVGLDLYKERNRIERFFIELSGSGASPPCPRMPVSVRIASAIPPNANSSNGSGRLSRLRATSLAGWLSWSRLDSRGGGDRTHRCAS